MGFVREMKRTQKVHSFVLYFQRCFSLAPYNEETDKEKGGFVMERVREMTHAEFYAANVNSTVGVCK